MRAFIYILLIFVWPVFAGEISTLKLDCAGRLVAAEPREVPRPGFMLPAIEGSISERAAPYVEKYYKKAHDPKRARELVAGTLKKGAQWIVSAELPRIMEALPPVTDKYLTELHGFFFSGDEKETYVAGMFMDVADRRYIVLSEARELWESDSVGDIVEEEMAHLDQFDGLLRDENGELPVILENGRVQSMQVFLTEFAAKRFVRDRRAHALLSWSILAELADYHESVGGKRWVYAGFLGLARALGELSRLTGKKWNELEGAELMPYYQETMRDPARQKRFAEGRLRVADPAHLIMAEWLLHFSDYGFGEQFEPYLRAVFAHRGLANVGLDLMERALAKLRQSPSDYDQQGLRIFRQFLKSKTMREKLGFQEFTRIALEFVSLYPLYMEHSLLAHDMGTALREFAEPELMFQAFDVLLRNHPRAARNKSLDSLLAGMRLRPELVRPGFAYLDKLEYSPRSALIHDLRLKPRDVAGALPRMNPESFNVITEMVEEGAIASAIDGMWNAYAFSFSGAPDQVVDTHLRAVRMASGRSFKARLADLVRMANYFVEFSEEVPRPKRQELKAKIRAFLKEMARGANVKARREAAEQALGKLW